MPLYEYVILNDDGSEGETFEVLQKISDPPLKKHPADWPEDSADHVRSQRQKEILWRPNSRRHQRQESRTAGIHQVSEVQDRNLLKDSWLGPGSHQTRCRITGNEMTMLKTSRASWQVLIAATAFVVANDSRLALAADTVDYAKQVKPILAARCFRCHGALKQEGRLRLDTVAAIQRGGENGAAIIPENPMSADC